MAVGGTRGGGVSDPSGCVSGSDSSMSMHSAKDDASPTGARRAWCQGFFAAAAAAAATAGVSIRMMRYVAVSEPAFFQP